MSVRFKDNALTASSTIERVFYITYTSL